MGVKLALGNSGMTLKAARAKDRKKWRGLVK